jgi:hypothetical protein
MGIVTAEAKIVGPLSQGDGFTVEKGEFLLCGLKKGDIGRNLSGAFVVAPRKVYKRKYEKFIPLDFLEIMILIYKEEIYPDTCEPPQPQQHRLSNDLLQARA